MGEWVSGSARRPENCFLDPKSIFRAPRWGTRRSVLKNKLRFKDQGGSMFAQQLDEFGQAALLVRAKVVVDVPA